MCFDDRVRLARVVQDSDKIYHSVEDTPEKLVQRSLWYLTCKKPGVRGPPLLESASNSRYTREPIKMRYGGKIVVYSVLEVFYSRGPNARRQYGCPVYSFVAVAYKLDQLSIRN